MRALIVAVVLLVAGLAVFSYIAPYQPASFAAWSGVVGAFLGIVCVFKPLRFAGVRSRRVGAAILAGSLMVLVGALLWPARAQGVVRRQSLLDQAMPQYEFSEVHEERVHAAPDRVVAAWQQVTFDDLKVAITLMRLRQLAVGRLPSRAPGRSLPILKILPAAGFTMIHEENRELVFVMAGRPWAGRGFRLRDGADFAAFAQPDSIRVASNLRVVDEGGGWSRIITETRVQATDSAARRTMARYWRVIAPGSGMIRCMWLKAIRERAERSASTEVVLSSQLRVVSCEFPRSYSAAGFAAGRRPTTDDQRLGSRG